MSLPEEMRLRVLGCCSPRGLFRLKASEFWPWDVSDPAPSGIRVDRGVLDGAAAG